MNEQDFRDMTARMVDAGKITEEERQQLLEAYAAGEITAEDLPLAMEEFSTSLLDALMLAAVLEWLLREEDDSGGLVLPAGKSAKDFARWAASLRRTAIQRQREAADGSDKITDRTAEHWEEQVDRLRVRYQLIGGPSGEADQETREEAREGVNEILEGLPFRRKRRLARDFVDYFHEEANQRAEQYLFGGFDDGLRRWQVAIREAMRDDLMAMAAAGKGRTLNESDLNRLGRVWRRQQSHLQRFAEEIAARREAEKPMTKKQIKARSRMYAGAEYSAFWRFAGEEKGQGWTVEWHSQDDGGVCPRCLIADKTMSPFPAGYPHPVPGSPWCRGGGACRCWLTFSFDPEAFAEAESRWEERWEQRRREYYDVMRTDPLLNMDAGGVVTAGGQGRRMN